MSLISDRKRDHLEIAASGRADFRRRTTLLEDVMLVHQALPELSLDDVDLGVSLLGGRLRAPLYICGMTGGTAAATEINRDLARAAEKLGLAFGVGSQRAMAELPELAVSYRVRDVAPEVFLIGNLGVVQARAYGVDRVQALVDAIGANAMAIHLNPAMELVQASGDRDFRGAIQTLRDLNASLSVPLVVKETGCGISPESARLLMDVGIDTVDVAGAGGTSWTAVETQRGQDARARALGAELWDWGVPTAVSTIACTRVGLTTVASGGVRTALDIARALALGATAGGVAAPVLRAHAEGGYDRVVELLGQWIETLRAIALLCGVATVEGMHTTPRVLGAELGRWCDDLGLR